MDAPTTREQIAALLRDRSMTAGELADAVESDPETVIDHVRHVARSVDDGTVHVAPPRCRECGFDGFDDPANRPSRCPSCSSEAIDDPTFTIR